MGGWINGWVNSEGMDGWINGWMDGWMDGTERLLMSGRMYEGIRGKSRWLDELLAG